MEGNKGFEVPKNEPDTDEEALDYEIDTYETWEDHESEHEKRDREICERILKQGRLKDVVNIFGVSTEKAYYVEFTREALLHVEALLVREVVGEAIKETQFIITCCETLERFGFPQESIARAIVQGLVREVVSPENESFLIFTETNTNILNFIKKIQSSYPTFDTNLLVTPETQAAALLRVRKFQDNSGRSSDLKTPRELIRAFQLRGPEATEVMRRSVQGMIERGEINFRKVENLSEESLVGDYYIDDEVNTKGEEKKLDEAWKKLQERYEITETYQEMSRSLFDQALVAGDNVNIRNICNRQSQVLSELVTAQTLPAILQLAEDTMYVASNIQADFGGASYGDKGWIIGAVLEQFDIPSTTLQKWFKYTSEVNKLYLQRFCKEVLDPDAVLTLDILGDGASAESYTLVKSIKSGKDGDLTHAGIMKSGEAGIQEVRVLLSQVKQTVLREDFDVSVLLDNPVLHDFAQHYLRIDRREFGTRNLRESAKLYHEQGETINPLDELVYQKSEPLRIQTSEVGKDFEYSEQLLSALSTLTTDLRKARDLAQWVGEKSETKKPFSHLVQHLDEEVARVVAKLYRSRQNISEEKQKFIDERIAKLESLKFRDLSQLDQNLQALMQIPEAHSIARQILFTFVYTKRDPDGIYNPQNPGEVPTLDGIAGVMNFVDHIGYQETWKKYFKDKKSRNAFRSIASTRALEEELERMQRSAKGEAGTTVMQFVPTRGFLMEISGSLGDACWQDVNKNLIAVEHPNFTSVTFVQNPKTKDQRIAGACLLIETLSQDGEPLLVIRGLNPLENVINRLSVEDFYQKFTDYCQGIALRSGRKLAIVIDDHSGGSSTNRPVLFQYLRNLELRKTVLASNADTEFNGYTITDNTFLVE